MSARWPENGALRAEREERGWSYAQEAAALRALARSLHEPEPPADANLAWRWEAGVQQPGPYYRRLLCRLYGRSPDSLGLGPVKRRKFLGYLGGVAIAPLSVVNQMTTPASGLLKSADQVADALRLDAWISSTNTSDETLEYLTTATSLTARDHVYLPSATVLTKALRIHQQIQMLLQGGKQRLRQSADLFRIDAGLLGHICLLFGDIHHDEAAKAYAAVAVAAADEAGSSPAEAFSAQAQIARWRHRYAQAADLAYQGFACRPPTSIRVLLACQEANAAALAGDLRRARHALAQAEATRGYIADERSDSVWSCPPGRYALYRLSIALNSGDATTALREADVAQTAWPSDQPKPFGTWAHLCIAAAHAHLISGSVDGAAHHIDPVLALPPDYRLSTLTEHMTSVRQLLLNRRFNGSAQAGRLLKRIDEFNSHPAWEKQ
jgi:transcriptional regulator with XRE-family HTH domain